jgi:hypothetical protein
MDNDEMAEKIMKKLGAGGDVVTSPEPEAKEPEGEITVEVLPSKGITDLSVGLIPATSLLPARVLYKGGKPEEDVTFKIPDGTAGTLSSGSQKGGSVTVKTNAKGEAFAEFTFDDKTALTEALTIPVSISSEEKKSLLSMNFQMPWKIHRVTSRDLFIFSQELLTFNPRVIIKGTNPIFRHWQLLD